MYLNKHLGKYHLESEKFKNYEQQPQDQGERKVHGTQEKEKKKKRQQQIFSQMKNKSQGTQRKIDANKI